MSLTVTDRGQPIQALRMFNDGATTNLTIGATATSFTPGSQIVRVCSLDTAYCLNVGGTAATTDAPVPANVVEYALTAGQSLSCISATGGTGTLAVSEAV